MKKFSFQFVKRLHLSISDAFQSFGVPLRSVIRDSWQDITGFLKPLIVRSFITLESAAWNVMKDILGEPFIPSHLLTNN